MLGAASETEERPTAPVVGPAQVVIPLRPEPLCMDQLMRQHLERSRPTSDAEALRMLRDVFPAASLAQRVAALASLNR